METLDRRTRKRVRSRQAILDAAHTVMSEKGIDQATMAEISETADVGLGTLYNHFASKHDLAVAVLDIEIADLARAIDVATADFTDPAQVFAFGMRTVMEHAITNDRWQELLARPDVIAERFRAGFGPFATRDIGIAADAGRFTVDDVDVAWNMAVWAAIGTSASVCREGADHATVDTALVGMLGLVGMNPQDARLVADALPASSVPTSSIPTSSVPTNPSTARAQQGNSQ